MIWAVFKMMALRLVRDPGSLLLALALPGLIYIIFAAIFSNATGGNLDLRVAVLDAAQTPASLRILDSLDARDDITLSRNTDWTVDDVRERIRYALDDVGIVITSDPAVGGVESFTLVEEGSRDVASDILKGHLRAALAVESQQAIPRFRSVSSLGDTIDAPDDPSVAYYIGAVGIMFILFSTLQSAAVTLEEREVGISARLLVGRRGSAKVSFGRFLFLTALGLVQIVIICAVAQGFFNVPISAHLGPVALACLATSVFAAGFALLIASLCRTPSQLQSVSTFTVLVLSAIGGSMVPRFMMPGWLQDVSRFTPNGAVIDLHYGILARGQSLAQLWELWCILLAGGVILTLVAGLVSQRLGRL